MDGYKILTLPLLSEFLENSEMLHHYCLALYVAPEKADAKYFGY